MTENLKKANDMLKGDRELLGKFAAEMKKSKDADKTEAICAAAKNVLGIELTTADVEELKRDSREMSPEDMELVSGGNVAKNVGVFALNRLVDVGNIFCFFFACGATPFDYYEYD